MRRREIIGQIVACPRCDSMVQVDPPAGEMGSGAAKPIESVAPQPVVSNDFAEAIPKTVSVELEPASVDPITLPPVVAMVKYRLVAWTLASFFVGATLGGAVFFWRSGSVEEEIEVPEVAALPETVEVVAPVPVEVSEPPLVEAVAPAVEPFSEEPVVAVDAVEPELVVSQEVVVAKPRTGARFDPLDLDPDTLDLKTLEEGGRASVVVEPAAPKSDADSSQEISEPLPPTTLPIVRRDPLQEPMKTLRAAEVQLAQRFSALQADELPISDFLRLISQLGGVPISVAPEQLQMAGITARKRVAFDVKDTSLAESLRKVLEPLHLEVTTQGPQVVVVRQEAAKIRAIEYPLDDLLASATSIENIVGWVEQFVAPTVPQASEHPVTLKTSSNSLRIEQTQQFQYQVLIFLERLRLARKLQPRSRFPVERLAGAPAYAVVAKRLRVPTTFTFSHYTPMSEVVRFWQRELAIPILVDWPALASSDLWPDSRIACSIENKPWQEALDQVLEPLGLGWRATLGGAIEITSAEKVRTQLQLELVPLRRDLGNEVAPVLEALRNLSARQLGKIAYDPAGNVLIVLQSAATQRLIYQWLVDQGLIEEKLDKND